MARGGAVWKLYSNWPWELNTWIVEGVVGSLKLFIPSMPTYISPVAGFTLIQLKFPLTVPKMTWLFRTCTA